MSAYAVDLAAIRAAADRVRGVVHRTPVMTSETVDRLAGRSVVFKCENLQKTGAFKYRGATNAVRNLSPGAAATFETIPAGSLVIPMDNAHQALSGTPFNLRAYGLVNALLHTNIPVKWAIAAGKAKDGIDFAAEAQRLLPTTLAASNFSLRSGPFIVHRDFTNRALPVMSAYGAGVAVFRVLLPSA